MNHIEDIKTQLDEANRCLEAFNIPENHQKINRTIDLMVNCIQNGHKIISCGNGGSMSDSMHFAEEMTGRFRENRNPLPAIAVSDPSYLSCVANDYGYDLVFSRFITAIGREGDVLLCISTSGNSTNIIEAAKTAKEKNMIIVSLTGKDGGKLSSLSDVEIRAPKSKYADRAQEVHIKIIHTIILGIEKSLG